MQQLLLSLQVSKLMSHSKIHCNSYLVVQKHKNWGKKINIFPYIMENITYTPSVNIQRSGRKMQWLPTQWDVTFSGRDLELNNRGASAAPPSSSHLPALQESSGIHSGHSLWRLQVILPCLFSYRLTAFSAREHSPHRAGKHREIVYLTGKTQKRYILTIIFSLFPTFLIAW